MANIFYDLIVIAIAAAVGIVFMVSASREIHKSMDELNEHNKAKKSDRKYRVQGITDKKGAIHPSLNE